MESRRTFIATVGAAALAGCVTHGGDRPTETATGASPADGTVESPDADASTATAEPPDVVESEWPMPAHDPGRTSFAPEADGPTDPLGTLWSVSTGASLSGPVLADETAFVGGDDGVVRAFDARSGDPRWQKSVDAAAGTPRIVAGTAYVPTADGVVALDAGDGSRRWSVDAPGRAGLLVAAHGLYHVDEGSEPAALVCREREGGTERWRAPLDGPWTARLLAGEEHVVVSTDTNSPYPWIFAADSGEFAGQRRPVRGNDFVAEQFLLDGSVFAADPMFGEIEAASLPGRDGPDWTTGIGAYGGFDLAGGAESIFLGAQGEAPGSYALDLASGETTWHVEAEMDVAGPPVVAGEAVVFPTDAGLRCHDPADGTERWRLPVTVDGVALADDLLYATRGDRLLAFRSLRR